MIAIIQQVWGRAWRIGVAIARCESGLRPAAVHYNRNGTWDAGLFQINQIHGIPKAQLLNPSVNARYAYQLYVKQGTRPWRASQRCWARVV
jgi:hypothetical protein